MRHFYHNFLQFFFSIKYLFDNKNTGIALCQPHSMNIFATTTKQKKKIEDDSVTSSATFRYLSMEILNQWKRFAIFFLLLWRFTQIWYVAIILHHNHWITRKCFFLSLYSLSFLFWFFLFFQFSSPACSIVLHVCTLVENRIRKASNVFNLV